MKFYILKSLGLSTVICFFALVNLTQAKQGITIPIWPEGVPGAHTNSAKNIT